MIAERELGPDHFDLSVMLNDYANLLQGKGDFAVAKQVYGRALAIREKIFGPDDSSVGVLVHNLASIYTGGG